MKKVLIIILLTQLMWACGDSDTPAEEKSTNDLANQSGDLNADTSTLVANSYCSAQTRLQLLSTGLLSAYSVKGNGSDLNYCGGEISLSEDDPNFEIAISDYCFNFRDQQLTLNGTINGTIESGANFTSEIPQLTITGDAVDLTISGKTWDGRADDMFISITVTDNISGETIALDEVSIKKGELDFGFITLSDLGRFEFKFIEHFNAELTQGQLFLYGTDEQLVIITAENGTMTVVYKESKLDQGTLLDSNCGV